VSRRPAWRWIADALAEQDFLDFEEPYRARPRADAGAMPGRFYVVGGAVRDALLGRPASDRDWVAVGGTPKHCSPPATGRWAATSRSSCTRRRTRKWRWRAPSASRRRGYHGFSSTPRPEVTLEQDLARRDLTINAMARDADGRLIDPFGGERDLRAGVLRHVSDAFAEDPVRLLRLARFAARFRHLHRRPRDAGADASHGHQRRGRRAGARAGVAGAVARADGNRPSRMFEVLRECGALARLLPEVDRLWGVPQRPNTTPRSTPACT
jgi:tRNA nucleotidyltransferase (CCA-adding enzyme)